MNEERTRLKMRMWLELKDEGALFGPGTMYMLQLIDELGSLNKAAAELGMSYRRAWGRLQEAETRIGRELVEHVRGRKGYRLTPFGREALEAWRRWQNEVEEFARQRARELFPEGLRPQT
ncbi:molybdate transport system regulatory protein [Paucidesulfovibrio gracilis DSM 16080]|uniref:Molybdate transport system regulatory protein n=1 Tax=Paucidesulfovibrio gracilis DSM 16080 TaxID=1121449 RepID=A0A1T4WT34_9BACT|nr:LysR family transcriptional regulator [Paucidesulfovibrio gracilis]SKA80523.1 molybdate transport system regulatory protein [Paucidesulfovibrio gracilis DSM 16080]